MPRGSKESGSESHLVNEGQLTEVISKLDGISNAAKEKGKVAYIKAGERGHYDKEVYQPLSDENGNVFSCEKFYDPLSHDYVGFNITCLLKMDLKVGKLITIEDVYFMKKGSQTWSVQHNIFFKKKRRVIRDELPQVPVRAKDLLDTYSELLEKS